MVGGVSVQKSVGVVVVVSTLVSQSILSIMYNVEMMERERSRRVEGL